MKNIYSLRVFTHLYKSGQICNKRLNAPAEVWTCNLQISVLTLYQLSYWATVSRNTEVLLCTITPYVRAHTCTDTNKTPQLKQFKMSFKISLKESYYNLINNTHSKLHQSLLVSLNKSFAQNLFKARVTMWRSNEGLSPKARRTLVQTGNWRQILGNLSQKC